jgi:hypothetical protein
LFLGFVNIQIADIMNARMKGKDLGGSESTSSKKGLEIYKRKF